MLVKNPTAFRPAPRRGRKSPPGLTLVSATFTVGGPYVRLTFDRPVSISAIDVTTIFVDSQTTGVIYRGTGTATLFAPQTVHVPLATYSMSSGTQVLLTASAATKIVADGGAQWLGVTNLSLPF